MSNDKYDDYVGTEFIRRKKDKIDSGSKKRFTKRIKIGEGGQGEVYKVFDSHLKIYRAMKIIHPQYCSNKEFVKNYQTEVNITSQLNFPNIVKVYDADIEDEKLFIIMDFVDGKCLAGEKYPEIISALIISRVSEALQYAHNAKLQFEGQTLNGVIHGDIKPENLMLKNDGEVMIMDFGLSTSSQSFDDSSSGVILGSLKYMAPEQIDGERSSKQTDIYALGITLYKLISGKTGYEKQSHTQIIKHKSQKSFQELMTDEIHPTLNRIIKKATEFDPRDRYQNITELQKDLDAFIQENYIINNNYKNIIGAFINFQMVPMMKDIQPIIPQKIQQEQIKSQIEEKEEEVVIPKKMEKPPKEKTVVIPEDREKKQKKKTPYLVYFILILIVGMLGFISYKMINSDKSKEEVSNEIVKNDTQPKEKISKPKKQSTKKTEKSKPKKTAKKKTSAKTEIPATKTSVQEQKPVVKQTKSVGSAFSIVVLNPQKLKGKIYLDGDKKANLKGKESITIKLKKAGSYILTIKTKGRATFQQEVNIDKTNSGAEVTFNPLTYTVTIQNPEKVDVNLFINNKLISHLDNNYVYSSIKPQTFELIIKNDQEKYIEVKKSFILDDTNPVQEFIFKPQLNMKYKITIDNPNLIDATFTINNSEKIKLESIFQKGYADNTIRTLRFEAFGFKTVEEIVDFSKKDEFNITYKPKALDVHLIIKNTPKKAKIFVGNNEKPISATTPDTDIASLKYGETYDIKITKYGFNDFITKITIDAFEKTIHYNAEVSKGIIQFEPELDANLLLNTQIWLGGNKLESATRIEDLKIGNYKLRVNFVINDYQQTVNQNVKVIPYNNDPANITVIKLDIDVVRIKSTLPDTKIYIDNLYIGTAPKTIPFIDASLAVVDAKPPQRLAIKKSINPKNYSNSNLVFRFSNEQAETLYREANAILSEYIFINNEGNDLLNEAQIKLEEVIRIDKTYSEAYSKLLFISSEKIMKLSSGGDKELAQTLYRKLQHYLTDATEFMDDHLELSIAFKNAGKGYFEYSYNFMQDQEMGQFMINTCLPILQKSIEEKKLKKDKTGLSAGKKYDLQEGACYLAKCYQVIYEKTGDNKYKSLAKRTWSNASFSPLVNAGKSTTSPFKSERQKWKEKLN